jgi:hypothetical protein
MSQHLKWRLVFTGILSLVMSGLVSAFVTLVNVGYDASFFVRVLRAWATAFPFAWLAALLWAPTARRIAAKIVTPPPGA